MITTTEGILMTIEEYFDTNIKNQVFENAIKNVPNYPIQLLIDSINAELIRLHMPYVIEDLLHPNRELWKMRMNLNPDKLNWNEIVNLTDRGEAVYQKLLEPFKNANCIFPNTLKDAMKLFKLDPSDNWNLGTYRDWLIGINTTFYPHECKAIMQKLMALTVKT